MYKLCLSAGARNILGNYTAQRQAQRQYHLLAAATNNNKYTCLQRNSSNGEKPQIETSVSQNI